MIIVCDIDNTLNNLQEVIVDMFNYRKGTGYTLDHFTDCSVENVLPVDEAIIMKEMYGMPDVYDKIKPIHGCQDALQKLINDGHQVYLVTDMIPSVCKAKTEWLHHYFPFIDDAHIVSMKHKHLFKCDVMIEDNAQNLITGVLYHRICFDRPWNRNVHDCAYSIHRCDNWKDIINIVKELENKE